MIDPEDNVFLDLSTSCSQDEAVKKLLGWSRGPILRRKIQVTEEGITEDQLRFIPLTDISLTEQLTDLLEAARNKTFRALTNNEPHDVLDAHDKAEQRVVDLIKQVHDFHLDITDALNEGASPPLHLDEVKSRAENVPHITLRSLERWAKAKYGISIGSPPSSPGQPSEPTTPADSPTARDNGGISSTKSPESLAITFAFLAEAYARKHPAKLVHSDQRINVDALSKELAEIISQATQRQPPRGQGHESIRKRIDEALKLKDLKLRSR